MVQAVAEVVEGDQMNTDILSDEVLAEIERREQSMREKFFLPEDNEIRALLRYARALQAEREELIYDLNETRRLAFNRGQQTKIAVEAFRQRAATRLRASGDEFGAPEYYAAADIVESLPATEEVQR